MYCQKQSTIAACGECKEHYCAKCVDAHTCGIVLFVGHMRSDMDVEFSHFALCSMLCREGWRCTFPGGASLGEGKSGLQSG